MIYNKQIEGISNLTKIKTLNLAANRIETLENAFLNQTSLEVLNIAGNPLKSFHQILYLTQYKTLKTYILLAYNYQRIFQ